MSRSINNNYSINISKLSNIRNSKILVNNEDDVINSYIKLTYGLILGKRPNKKSKLDALQLKLFKEDPRKIWRTRNEKWQAALKNVE